MSFSCELGISLIIELFLRVFDRKLMLDGFQTSVLLPISKVKKDVKTCDAYR